MLQQVRENTTHKSLVIKHVSQYAVLWFLFFALSLYFFLVNTGTAYCANQELFLETDNVRIAVSGSKEYLNDWSVYIDSSSDSDDWISLVNHDADGNAISRHLDITGQSSKGYSWSEISNTCLSYESTTLDGQLSVRSLLRDSEEPYRLFLEVILENTSSEILKGFDVKLTLGPGLGERPEEGLGIAENLYSYVEPIISSDNHVETIPLKANGEIWKFNLASRTLDWVGLNSRYFALVLAPIHTPTIKSIEYGFPEQSHFSHIPLHLLTHLSMCLDVENMKPGEIRKNQFLIFSGSKTPSALKCNKNDLSKLLFANQWQWMRLLCFGLLWLLNTIHIFIPNWGVSIILLAMLVRVLIYPLSKKMMDKQHAYSQFQKIIHPEIQAIKKCYTGEDQSERILAVYKKYGTSPFAGIIPLVIVVIQIPIFVALFHVLGEAFELREASFLWIDTLSMPDRLFAFGKNLPFIGSYFNLLPFLMALSTLLTIKYTPLSEQNSVFLIIMAVLFLILFYPFPSGMVLYWTMANILQIVQQFGVIKWSHSIAILRKLGLN